MLDMAGFAEPGVPVLANPGIRCWDQFMDLRAAGGAKFSVNKAGVVSVPMLGSVSAPSISLSGSVSTGIWSAAVNTISFSAAGVEAFRINPSANLQIGTSSTLGWGASFASNDITVVRDAASVLAQRAGTNAQTWRIYNTYTDASNYERLTTVAIAADDFKIIPEAAGTGTLRGLQLGVSGGKLGFYGTTAVTKPAALTAADASTVDIIYGAEEAAVIANLRTRVGELEAKLQSLGLLA